MNQSEINKKFEEEFYIEENDDWGSTPNPSEVQSFFQKSYTDLFREIVDLEHMPNCRFSCYKKAIQDIKERATKAGLKLDEPK